MANLSFLLYCKTYPSNRFLKNLKKNKVVILSLVFNTNLMNIECERWAGLK